MKRLILLAAATTVAASTAALADNTPAQEKKVTAPTVAPTVQPVQTSKAVRLSDAELEKITAAKATHEGGHGTTVVFNPGHASFIVRHKRGSTCINCF